MTREFGDPGNKASNPVDQVGTKLPHKVVAGPEILPLSCYLFQTGSTLGNISKWSACDQSWSINSTEIKCYNSRPNSYMQVTKQRNNTVEAPKNY